MTGIILVHGAWFGGWIWQRVSPLLRERGYTVIDEDMPGKGLELAKKEMVTLEDQMDQMARWADRIDGPVHLVAHAMGGGIITEFAERAPDRVASTIYIASLFGAPGEQATTLPFNQDINSRISMDRDGSSIEVSPRDVAERSFSDFTPDDLEYFAPMVEQHSYDPPLVPNDNPTGHWQKIPRAYILCLKNRMVLQAQQFQMTKRYKFFPVVHMNTGHCPFISQPQETADHIDRIIDRVVRLTANRQQAAATPASQ